MQVSQQTLDILETVVRNERELVKPYANTLVPNVVRTQTSLLLNTAQDVLAPQLVTLPCTPASLI